MHLLPLLLLLTGTIQLAVVVTMVDCFTGTHYKYNISGTLLCSNKHVNGRPPGPMPDTIVYLRESDTHLNLDDDLGNVRTDSQGHFEGLVGEEDEGDPPELYIQIYEHTCGILKVVNIGMAYGAHLIKCHEVEKWPLMDMDIDGKISSMECFFGVAIFVAH
jgi:hypothetical protein